MWLVHAGKDALRVVRFALREAMPEEWVEGFLAALSEEKRQELAAKGVTDPAGWIASIVDGALGRRKPKGESESPEKPAKRESWRDRSRDLERGPFYRPVEVYGEAIQRELELESDRGAILIWHGQLDRLLANVLKMAFVRRSRDLDEIEELLNEDSGPLQSFSLKARLAGAFGLIGESTRRALLRFNKLRNGAAHRPDPFQLSDIDVERVRDELSDAELTDVKLLADVLTLAQSALQSSRRNSAIVNHEAERAIDLQRPPRILLSAIVSVLFDRVGGAIR